MKISSLLLSSAALVFAGSAIAADLPAKKGAPAAKAATGCPAFGAGYFQIPGGDTCIKFSGFVRTDFASTTGDGEVTVTPSARLVVDTMSNSDIGAIRSSFRWTTDTDDAIDQGRAFVSVAGLTVGQYGSITDVSGLNGINYGYGALAGDSGIGAKYDVALGGMNLTVAAQTNSATDTTSTGSTGMDIVGALSGKAGMLSYTVFGVSHPVDGGSGYAFGGQVGVSAGAVTVGTFGASAHGASNYTGGTLDDDLLLNSSVYGVTGSYNYGQGSVFAEYGQATEDGTAVDFYEVGVAHNIAKGLSVTPSLYSQDGTNTMYLRINRDF